MNKIRKLKDDLEAERECNEKEIERLKVQTKCTGDRIKSLECEEKQLERRQRNRRIFTRGGMLEAFLMKPLILSDDDVYAILKTAFGNHETNDFLKSVIAKRENECCEKKSPSF